MGPLEGAPFRQHRSNPPLVSIQNAAEDSWPPHRGDRRSPDRARNLPARLARTGLEQPWALTGSLAAGRIAPVAAPGIAVVYTDDPDEVVEALGLLPAESGANVVLARPYDRAALARRWVFDGVWFVSPAQTAADCLTGSGRMPAEGEALVEWMRSHEDRWRANDFAASPDPLSP